MIAPCVLDGEVHVGAEPVLLGIAQVLGELTERLPARLGEQDPRTRVAVAILHQEALDVGRVDETFALARQQGHGGQHGQQALGVALGDARGPGNGGDGVVAMGDRGEDLELDGSHQGRALPISLGNFLQPRGVEALAIRHSGVPSLVARP